MREYGAIHTRYWTWAQEVGLSDSAKLLGAYLLTSPHSNSLGCYRVPKNYIADDLGYSIDRVSKGYSELENHHFLTYCEATKFLLLRKYLKWNPIQNTKHGIGVGKLALQIPKTCKLLKQLVESLRKYGGGKLPDTLLDTLCDRVSIPYGIQYRYTDQDQDTDQDQENEDTIVSSCQEPQGDSGPEPVLKFPLVRKKPDGEPEQFLAMQEDVDGWQDSYPGIDALMELRKCRQWNIDNPTNRKTSRGIRKHINGWLARAQNKAPRVSPARAMPLHPKRDQQEELMDKIS